MTEEIKRDELASRAWLESLGVKFRDEPDPDLSAELLRRTDVPRIPVASFGQLATMVGGIDPLVDEGFVVAVIGAFGDHTQFHDSRDTAMSHFRLFREPPLPSACYLMSALLVGGPAGLQYLVGDIELKETEGSVKRLGDLLRPW